MTQLVYLIEDLIIEGVKYPKFDFEILAKIF